jgi:hypothetical protein
MRSNRTLRLPEEDADLTDCTIVSACLEENVKTLECVQKLVKCRKNCET